MTIPHPVHYRRTTELAADAMINEGGAVQQPSREESDYEFAHLRRRLPACWQEALTPARAFWTGFAAGLAVSLLERRLRGAPSRYSQPAKR